MAQILLDVDDAANRLTLQVVLENEGHEIVDADPDVVLTDAFSRALEHAPNAPTILLAAASQIKDAVQLMGQGVFGYIFVPFQPGEAGLMIERALASESAAGGGTGAEALTSLAEIEARHIRLVLRECKYNQAQAAKVLGIGRNTLWRKLKSMGVRKKDG